MGIKFYRLFEFFYLIIAAFFTYEAFNAWSEERTRAYLFLFFVAMTIFMFFFRRRFRKKMEERNKE